MTCLCGYQMCYLCRADLRRDANHFCWHFRSTPGTRCSKCRKCMMFEEEVVEDVLKEVEEAAEEEWENARQSKRIQ